MQLTLLASHENMKMVTQQLPDTHHEHQLQVRVIDRDCPLNFFILVQAVHGHFFCSSQTCRKDFPSAHSCNVYKIPKMVKKATVFPSKCSRPFSLYQKNGGEKLHYMHKAVTRWSHDINLITSPPTRSG